MRVLIYIKVINDGEFNFDNSFVQHAKVEFSELTVLDIDNRSGAEMFQYSQRLLGEATQSLGVVEFLSVEGVGKVAQWLESNIKKHLNLHLFVIGSCPPFVDLLLRKYPVRIQRVESQMECMTAWKQLWS